MADLVIKKRPVVLSLAELQKYPTLADRYAATLPFKYKAINCTCSTRRGPGFKDCCGAKPPRWFSSLKAKWIKRTGERWTWFSSARDLDDIYGERLGTLNYLPWEIRQIIIKMLFDERFCSFRVVFVENIIGGIHSPMNGYYKHPWYWKNHEPHDGLWLASPSTKFEMDHYYFSNTKFIFRSPYYLYTLADRLPASEWSLLRSIMLHVRHDDSLREWMSACARLPPDLVSIEFNVYSRNTMRGVEIHGQWFIIPIGTAGTPVELLDRAVILVNTLGKLARRVAAKAEIGLAVGGMEVEEGDELRNTHHRVLHDLDPWSEGELSWWEEERKIDFEGDETFNQAA